MQEKRPTMRRLGSRVVAQVLDKELSEVAAAQRWIYGPLKIAVMVGRDHVRNLLNLQAMALAFKTLLTLAPLLAVVFSILKGFGVHNRMGPALAEALAPLGEKGVEVTAHLIGFVDKMKAGALGSIGLIALFVAVLSLMSTIEESFNRIWRVKSPRRLARKFSDYLSVVLVGPVLVFAAVTITATLQNNTIVKALLSLQALGAVILALLKIVPYLTLWGAFTFVYLFVPNTRVKLRAAVFGGFVAAVLWQSVGWGFAAFVASSTHYYAIYSSFAILVLFLLWLQIGWVIVLLGAEVTYAYQHLHFFHGEREFLERSHAGREELALHLMLLVGRNFYHGLEPMNVLELAARLQLPAGLVKQFMDLFVQSRLILPLADGETFVLGRDPETISIKEILDCVRNSGKKITVPHERGEAESAVRALIQDVDGSMAEVLKGKTLQALILSLNAPETRG